MNQPDPTQRIGKIMIYLAWLLLLGLLTLLFNQGLEQRNNPNRDLVSRVTTDGIREVVLQSNASGHYMAPGQINGRSVLFLVDTGASYISVPARLADYLDLERGPPLRSMTANGMITVFATVAERVAVGDIVLFDVPVTLNPRMESDVILLGMSFLKDLEVNQKQGILTLRQH